MRLEPRWFPWSQQRAARMEGMRRLAPIAAVLVAPASAGDCCWSAWGSASQCGAYPSGGSGGLCNNDWTQKCTGGKDCSGDDPDPPTQYPPPVPEGPGKCCWSAWGGASKCGGYPSGSSGGLCTNDWTQSCTGDAGCVPQPPTPSPTPAPTPVPTPAVPTPPLPPPEGLLAKVIERLTASNSEGVFVYETPTSQWVPSDLYKWEDMIQAVWVMAQQGIGSAKLWVGEDGNSNYGMVNIAAFLAQSMQETIRYNACDENNWSDRAVTQQVGGEPYSATSACGQMKQSYQDYKCGAEEDAIAGGKMACDVDPNMMARAHTQAGWYGAPPKMFCAPKSVLPQAPKWDYASPWCAPEVIPFPDNVPLEEYFEYVRGGGSCKDYQGVKAGGWKFCNGGACAGAPAPLFGHPEGRTDVEGCCWWGRGVIQTTGVCNFGKLNYYMGKRAHDEGREALFPSIDFCKQPDAICDPEGPAELKWIAGFFYWLNAVQPYNQEGWGYLDELKAWVDAGMDTSDTSFINGASGIVNRGCHNPPNCGTGELHGGPERIQNFETVLNAMNLAGLLKKGDAVV